MEEAALTLCKKKKMIFAIFPFPNNSLSPVLKYFKKFIYLAMLGPSGGMQTLTCGM